MKSPLFKKQALDALLEVINDPEYATHQHHSDPDFTTQTGKDYAGRGSTEVENGVSVTIPPEAITAAIEPDQIDTDPDVEFHRQYDFMQMLKKTFRGWTGGNPFYHFQMPMNSVRLYSDGWKIQRFDKDTGVEGKTLEELKAYLSKADWVRNLKPAAPPYLERTIEGQIPNKKLTAATVSFIGPHSDIAPTKTHNKNYIWVYHPSYGFYFAEGMTADHIKLFKGVHASTSFPGAKIPNNLYDDCNRGYAWVKKSTKYISLDTSTAIEPEWDFIPQAVVKGFKKYFPGYTFDEDFSKLTSKKAATTVRFIGPHSDVPIAESRARYYCWLYHPDYGFYYGEGTESDHWRFIKGEYEGAMIPRISYDKSIRGYAEVNRIKKTVKLEISIASSQWENTVPPIAVKVFKKNLPGFEVSVKKSLLGSMDSPINEEVQEHTFFKESDPLKPQGYNFFKESDPEFEMTAAGVHRTEEDLNQVLEKFGYTYSGKYENGLHRWIRGKNEYIIFSPPKNSITHFLNSEADLVCSANDLEDKIALYHNFERPTPQSIPITASKSCVACECGGCIEHEDIPQCNGCDRAKKDCICEDCTCPENPRAVTADGSIASKSAAKSKQERYMLDTFYPGRRVKYCGSAKCYDELIRGLPLIGIVVENGYFDRKLREWRVPVTWNGYEESQRKLRRIAPFMSNLIPLNDQGELFSDDKTAAMGKAEKHFLSFKPGDRVVFYKPYMGKHEGTVVDNGDHWYYNSKFKNGVVPVLWDYQTDKGIVAVPTSDKLIHLNDQGELFASEKTSAIGKDEKYIRDNFKVGGRVRYHKSKSEGTIESIGPYNPRNRSAVIGIRWDGGNRISYVRAADLIPLNAQGELFSQEKTASSPLEAEAFIEWGGVYDHRHLELDEYKGTWEWTDYDASDALNVGRQVGECKSLEEAKEKLERVVFNIGEPRTYIHYSDDEHIKKQDYLAPEEKGFLRDTGVGTDIKPDFSKDYSPYTRDKDFLNSMGIKARKKAQEILSPQSMKNSPIHQYMRSLGQWYHVSGSLYRNVKHPEMVLSVFDDGWTIRQWGENIDSGEDINTLKTYLASHDLDTDTSMKPSPNRHVDVSLGPNTIEGEIVPERKRLNAAANKKLFHVTHTDKVPSIHEKGIIPLQTSNWVKEEAKERYGNGEIFAFSDPSDAVRWAGKMDWDFNQSMGTGKISIVAFTTGGEKWKTDTADPLSQASSKGKWLKATGWVKPDQITSVTAVTPEIIKSVIGGQIPKFAEKVSEIKTSKTAQAQKTSTALEVTLLFKRWRVKSSKLWNGDVLGREKNTQQLAVKLIPYIKKYSGMLRDIVHSNLVLFNGVPMFDKTLQALETVQGRLDWLETVKKIVKMDIVWAVRSAAAHLDLAFNSALYAYKDADDFLSKNSSTKSYGIGTPIGGTPNEFMATDNPNEDEEENDQMNMTGGLSITASWDVLATNYFDMFQQVLALPESRGLESTIKKEISWAKQTLKKADRIVWYLRWYRLHLESRLAGGSLRSAAAKAIFKNDLGMYSRKNPITKEDIPTSITSMTDLQNNLSHFLGLQDHAIQNKVWYFETPKQLVDDFKKLENDIRERVESERRTISEEDNDPEDEIFIGFPDGWAWWLLDRAYCSEEAKAMGHCGNSPRKNTGDRILSLRQPVMKGGNQYWSPHCTFILRAGKFLGEMKGRNNDKPVVRYHPYIIALLKDPRIFGIMGGGYLPKHNFHWDDLSFKEQDEIKQANPNFGNPDKVWEAVGKGDKAVATIATALGLAEDDGDPSSFNRDLDAFIVNSWVDVGQMLNAIGDQESRNAYDLLQSTTDNPNAFDDNTAPEERINILIDNGLSPRALKIMAEKIKAENPNELNRFIEIQKRLNPNFEFNLLDDSVLRDMLDYDRRIGGVIWPLVDMAFNMAGDKVLNERRISDLEYAITDPYEQDNDQANTVLRYGENAGQNFSWDASPVYELISYDEAVKLVSDPDRENKDLSNGQIKIWMGGDYNDGFSDDEFSEFYGNATGALERLLIKGSPQEKDPNQTQITFKERTPRSEKTDLKKYQRTTGSRKKSFVDIHETPTMLPPRDDMRRHLDTDEQDEAMHGVRDGIIDEPKLPKPKQIDPRIKGAALPKVYRFSSAGKTPRSKEEIINEIDYLYSIADHPEIPREESQRLLGEIKKLNQEFEANGYTHDHVRDDRPLTPEFLDMVDDVKGNVTHEKTINPHDKKWLNSFGVEGSKQAAFNRKEAHWIRKSSGSKIEETLKKAVKILGENGIPTLVAGGYAVQEYGYPRYTKDIDIIVPDRIQSIQLLIGNGFHKANTPNTVIDNETNEEVDLLLAGDRMNIGPVPFPVPSEITLVPKLITLEELIDLKLGSYASNPWGRTKDLADVTELIQRNSIPKEFMAKGLMNKAWNNLWDMMHQTPDNPIEPKESCFKVLSSVVEIENKIADDEDQLDSEGEYFLEQVSDAKEEAKRHFMEEDYIQQQAAEDGRTMEEMWAEIGEEFTANFYDYPYNPPKEKQKPIATPEFSTGDKEHLHGMGVLGSGCPLCKSANLKKVAGMDLTECTDCKGVYSIPTS